MRLRTNIDDNDTGDTYCQQYHFQCTCLDQSETVMCPWSSRYSMEGSGSERNEMNRELISNDTGDAATF